MLRLGTSLSSPGVVANERRPPGPGGADQLWLVATLLYQDGLQRSATGLSTTRASLHFTPTSASWMNQAETWFSILQRRALRRGVLRSVAVLRAANQRLLDGWNDDFAHPFCGSRPQTRFSLASPASPSARHATMSLLNHRISVTGH